MGFHQTPCTLQGSLEVADQDKRAKAARQGRAGQGRAGQGRAGQQRFTLPHRLVETLNRGPRSEPRAPMQMVSGALGSLGFILEALDPKLNTTGPKPKVE